MTKTPRQPLITVITVSYNAVKTIEQTMLSVLNQTYPNIEYIIIDGGSTDGTVDIIKKYADRLAYWVSEPDKGIYDAMNKGIDKAIGEWVYFLGADDILVQDVLKKIKFPISENIILYGNVFMTFRQKIYDGRFNSFKLVVRNIPHQAIFYPKKILLMYYYDLKYKYLADYSLNLKCWKNFSFKYIPIVVAIYNDNSVSSNEDDESFIRDRVTLFLQTLPIYCLPYIYYRYLRHKIKLLIK